MHRLDDMPLTLIAAVNNKGVLGDSQKTGLLWSDPEDLKRFSALTKGRTLIVGRKTYEQLPDRVKTDANRTFVVVTRQNWNIGTHTASTFKRAAELFPDAWVIGGGQIYKEAIDSGLVKHWYITRVDDDSDGDIRFPYELGKISETYHARD